jgi:hypothetical protein
MLKAQMGDQEINLPAWIQDHITNSENYIYQAAKGYHESDAQMDDKAGAEEMDEARFEKGEDVGGKGFEFKKIAAKATKQYGSKEAGQRVAGAVMKKVLNKEGKGYNFEKSAVESASGDKINNIGYDDMDLPIFFSATDDTISYHLGYGGEFEGKIYKYDGKTGKSIEIGDLKHYGDGQNHSADDDMHESQQELDENKMDKEELKQAQIEKAYDHLEKMKANTKLFSKEDIKKAEDRIEKLEAELDALAEKSTNESLDEFTVRRWQHYAGIK